jgi:hypothetical protein
MSRHNYAEALSDTDPQVPATAALDRFCRAELRWSPARELTTLKMVAPSS